MCYNAREKNNEGARIRDEDNEYDKVIDESERGNAGSNGKDVWVSG